MNIKLIFVILGISSFHPFSNYERIAKKNKSETYQSQDGEKLIAKQDCTTCHKLDKKVIGPSYLDIAKKYTMNDKNINYLSDKIIKGGSGVWGSIPMAGHSAIKKEDAKKIAKYILSLHK